MHFFPKVRNFGLVVVLLIAASMFGVSVQAATPAKGWVILGERQADFSLDRDRIVVGKEAGAFRELQFTVRGAPVEIYEMVVTFGNDRQFKPTVNFVFDSRTSSHVIDLPGDARNIKYVDFVYRTTAARKERRAKVTLYGR